MQTIYDWTTMAIFAGLVVLFLQRSMAPAEAQDGILLYLPPSIGCALANYLGNQGQATLASAAILVVLGYIYFVLKPFSEKL